MTALIICALVAAGSGVVVGFLLGTQSAYTHGFRDGINAGTEIWREAINAGADFVTDGIAADCGTDEEPK